MNLKKQLKHHMKQRDISAAKLSRMSGVSRQVLSQWLAGVAPRKLDQVKAVADALCTTVDDLCWGDGDTVKSTASIDSIPQDDWFSGRFEVKLRRIK